MKLGILSEMTIEDVRRFDARVVVMGFASTEPHGPVLPYGTDHFQCEETIRRGVLQANAAGARVLMYPTLPIGNNVNFKAFPFACRIGVHTLMQVALDVIEALEADGIRKIVLYCGHGGNTDALRAALRAHAGRRRTGEGAFVCLAAYPPSPPELVQDPSDHGGEAEVSRILHLREDLVRGDRIGVYPCGRLAVQALADPAVFFVRPWHLHVPASAGGDVTSASARKGDLLINHDADHLAGLLKALDAAELNDVFPYRE